MISQGNKLGVCNGWILDPWKQHANQDKIANKSRHSLLRQGNLRKMDWKEMLSNAGRILMRSAIAVSIYNDRVILRISTQ